MHSSFDIDSIFAHRAGPSLVETGRHGDDAAVAGRAAHAIDALRRGWPISIHDGASALTLLAVETADEVRLAAFDPDGRASLLVAAGRVETLALGGHLDRWASSEPVRLRRDRRIDLPLATLVTDPETDGTTNLAGLFDAIGHDPTTVARAALHLAMRSGILPAFYVTDGGPVDVALSVDEVATYDEPSRLSIVARARLPIGASEVGEIVAFRTPETSGEHIALIVGGPTGRPPLVRLHSECLTGDILGSLKCDCGPQLQNAIREMADDGWGILLYLRQEGRGIGLINKLRAYALQDRGFDTVEANARLGLPIDARDFRVAARMLRLLGEDRIRLLTNNPAKVAALASAGIAVLERVPHRQPANPHNVRYLATKRDRTGHAL